MCFLMVSADHCERAVCRPREALCPVGSEAESTGRAGLGGEDNPGQGRRDHLFGFLKQGLV